MGDSSNNSRSLGWVWMLVVAGVAFAGGMFFSKDKRPARISDSEMGPPQPLPGAAPALTQQSVASSGTTASPQEPVQPASLSAPAILATNQPGLLSAPITPAAGTGSTNGTRVHQVVMPAGTQPINGATSYNGIIIPHRWPPTNAYQSNKIMSLPYLAVPPPVINISTGRQLFVDDFLIDSVSNLTRVYHQAIPHTNNPVMVADKEWEKGLGSRLAIPANGGLWWDTTNYHFKMFYRAGPSNGLAMAISTNLTNWSKPLLHGPKSSNLAHLNTSEFSTVVLDHYSVDERFKLFRHEIHEGVSVLAMQMSADGTNWGKVIRRFGPAPKGSTVFHNPFRNVWVFNLADEEAPGKRRYWETQDLREGTIWERLEDAPLWVGADRLDQPLPELGHVPELHHLDVIPYESLMVGLFTIYKGDHPGPVGGFRHTEIHVGYSRDGFHWYRPDRRPFISRGRSMNAWDWSDVQSIAGGFNVLGRRLNFSYRARGRDDQGIETGGVGMVSIRRDGFVSMDGGKDPGILVTKPLKFSYAGYMLMNMKTNAPDGEIRVAVYSEAGRQLQITKNDNGEQASFSLENCVPIRNDQTLTSVNWNGIPHMGMLMNRPIRLVFQLKNASLYSFWISQSRRGRSEGYSAGGGIHYTGPIDNIGNRSYRSVAYLPPHLRPPSTNSTSANAVATKAPPGAGSVEPRLVGRAPTLPVPAPMLTPSVQKEIGFANTNAPGSKPGK